MDPSWVLSLPEQVAVLSPGERELTLAGPRGRLTLRNLSAGLCAAIRGLAAPGQTAGILEQQVCASDGPAALPRWYLHQQNLAQRRLLHLAVHASEKRLATLTPTAGAFALPASPASPDQVYVLSRFAWMQRHESELALESPLCPARLLLHDARVAALIHAASRPGTPRDIAARIADLPAGAALPLLGLLLHLGAVCPVDADGIAAEDANPALGCWQFHDLLFHARSRVGRHDMPVGATYRLLGRLEPPPAVAAIAGDAISLYRPELDLLQRDDPPYAFVQESRRSIREYAMEPITERQLGEFLYRVARVKAIEQRDVPTPAGPVRMDFAPRPYPAGGALYEMECYAAVASCRGLAPGLYRYDGVGHRLVRRAAWTDAVARLVSEAAQGAGLPASAPQVLLVLTARLPRVGWKYSGLAYALVLKHVGVIFQTMYLAATAMGLAPCAVGMGDSDLFARAAGLDYYAETSVGEFLLGSARQ